MSRKSKWKVICNYIAGVGKLYRAGRLLDVERPMESGNVEYYGEYCEDKDAVQETVDHLNEEERSSSKFFTPTECPVCGKSFIPAPEHKWKLGKYRFCSYHCYLKRQEQERELREQRRSYHKERRVGQYTLTGEKLATFANVEEAAKAIGYPKSTIRTCCQRGSAYGTGYLWKYEEE